MIGATIPLNRAAGLSVVVAICVSVVTSLGDSPVEPHVSVASGFERMNCGDSSSPRSPFAVMIDDASGTLLVANRDTATLSCIDIAAGKVSGEWELAPELTACIATSDGRYVLSAHQKPASVRLWRRESGVLEEYGTVSVPEEPVALLLSDDGTTLFVSSLWARAVSIVSLDAAADAGSRLEIVESIPLPFAPRQAVELATKNLLLVADGFGGQLAVIDLEKREIHRTLRIPGHNLRGLAWDPKRDEVIVAHQILNQSAETSRDGVFWGIVMTNNLRVVPLANLMDSSREPLEDAYVHFLGDPRAGAADPSGLSVTGDRTILVALGGVGEVAMGAHLDHSFERIKVGRRPVAITTDSAGEFAYVANMFSDTISVIDIERRRLVREIPLANETPGNESPERVASREGEALFYDASLSLDGWYSCHSCHPDGHSTQFLNDNLGDGSYGAPKRIPSLLGAGETGPWLWSGSQPDLQKQVHRSIVTTMQGEEPDPEQISQLAAFVMRLPAPPTAVPDDVEAVKRGGELFDSLGCNHCHRAPTYTSPKVFDVGIHDQHGRREFNPPSLRGVRLRGPYFHDNRAKTLKDVLQHEQHQLKEPLDESQQRDLIDFLRSL